MSQTAHLLPISLQDLTERELGWLVKLPQQGYHDLSIQWYLRQIANERVQLWRLEFGSAKGLVATSFQELENERELWIEFLCGEGWVKEAEAAWGALETFAKNSRATRISLQTLRPGMRRVFEKHWNMQPVAVVLSKELR